MSDEQSTKRLSAADVAMIHQTLESSASEDLNISVAADVIPRVDALLERLGSERGTEALERAAGLRRIFMAGLDALESELDD